MKISFISSGEQLLLKKIEESNLEEIGLWKLPSFVIPLITVALSLICYLIFRQGTDWDALIYFNLVLNGSFPLIALNQVSSGIYLFKYDKTRERELGITDTYYLRAKLFYLFIGIVLVNVLLYVHQVINSPFSTYLPILASLVISAAFVYFSTVVSKKIYLLQDSLLERTYDMAIKEKAQETKSHLEEKYGNP